jgi:two-component system nitrogen regulation sensor histidine kinase NtrY
VIFANREARRLLLGGARLEGRRFGEILAGCPVEMRRILEDRGDGIFTVQSDGETETYHLTRRGFQLNRRRHELYLLRRMTLELSRQESEIWKKVIRVISHELNNSLAPISSLAHSGSLIAGKPEEARRLESIHASIRERVDHLTRFLEGYARFARLPRPNRQRVDWRDWLDAPSRLYRFELQGDPPATPGFFDAAQLQQVLINLLKNAVEASEGEPEIAVRIDRLPDGGTRIRVADRGRGMSEEVMQSALLPFYSTKPAGSGVGLPLSREIIEAHGGSLRIRNREGGGTEVSLLLPPEP